MESRIFAAVFAVASLIFLLVMVPDLKASFSANPMFQTAGLGPTAIPYFAGGAVLILSILMFFERKPEDARSPVPEESLEPSSDGVASLRNLAIFTAILTGFIILMPVLGFLVASALFLAAVFLAFCAPSPLIAVIIAVAAPLAIDLLLREVFLIPLPELGWF
ncbi:MAG: hypothetical protein CL535_00500 [Ahrensia sp.]|nr:hypothetical protein [Ahrensia sp.]|tara:strand:+ start:44419 stop:44907 length:489 start_codon:yes stop_codon:yes gene_type:complete